MSNLDAILNRHVAAFNAKDPAEFMADFAPDAIVELANGRVLQGAEAIRAYFARAFALDPTVRLEIVSRKGEGLQREVSWVSKKGRRTIAHGSEIYLFGPEGRIQAKRTLRLGRL